MRETVVTEQRNGANNRGRSVGETPIFPWDCEIGDFSNMAFRSLECARHVETDVCLNWSADFRPKIHHMIGIIKPCRMFCHPRYDFDIFVSLAFPIVFYRSESVLFTMFARPSVNRRVRNPTVLNEMYPAGHIFDEVVYLPLGSSRERGGRW